MLRTPRIAELCLAGAIVVASSACGTEARTPPSAAGGHQRPPVAVTVTPAAACDLTDTIDVVGSLAPKFFADIKSEVTGVVTAVYVTEWVPVAKGAPLARLDTAETEAAIEALKAVERQARVAETRARREHGRALQLQEYGLITSQALDEARSELEAAEAGASAARAQIRTAEARLAKSFIKAPMDGVVSQRRVNVGDRVENMGGGEPMFRIVDSRLLELTVTVPSGRLGAVRVGQRLEFGTDAVAGRTFAGRVMFINPAVDEASRSVRVVAEVPNADRSLAAGLFVQGRIVVGTRNTVQVSRDALVDWRVAEHVAAVLVVRDGRAQKLPVRTGAVVADAVEIVEGLAAGDRVITRGGFAVRSGDRVTVAEPERGA